METKLSKFASKDMIGSSQHNGDACQFGDATKNALIRLCRQANEIGDELRILLAKLQAHGKTKLNLAVSSFLTVLKGIWSEERIQDVKNRLDQTQKQIMMETLVLTWYALGTYLDALSVQRGTVANCIIIGTKL